jgi:hypothetical protein
MNEILKIFVGSLAVSGIIVWLGKTIINKAFDAGLETYKNRLDLLKVEHQIRYSSLHEERAAILKEMFENLFLLEGALSHLTSPFQGPEWTEDDSRYINANEQLSKCINQLEISRIYFTVDFCDLLEESLVECRGIINGMLDARDGEINQKELAKYNEVMEFEEGQRPRQLWRKQREKVESDIKKRRLELAHKFRELIGVQR